jgi:putative transposase
MPDHLRWLMQFEADSPLCVIMKRSKGRSARCVNQVLERTGAVWQAACLITRCVGITTSKRRRATSIVDPLRAGVGDQYGDYPLSDAIRL